MPQIFFLSRRAPTSTRDLMPRLLMLRLAHDDDDETQYFAARPLTLISPRIYISYAASGEQL